jgi:hypothetical protein
MAARQRPPVMSKQRLYRVTFTNQGQVYEIYARQVSHGGLLGFVEVEQLVFGEKSTVVLDPGEEKLKTEFAHVARSFIPGARGDPHRRGQQAGRRQGQPAARGRRQGHAVPDLPPGQGPLMRGDGERCRSLSPRTGGDHGAAIR